MTKLFKSETPGMDDATRCGRSWEVARLAKANAGCNDGPLEALCQICVTGN